MADELGAEFWPVSSLSGMNELLDLCWETHDFEIWVIFFITFFMGIILLHKKINKKGKHACNITIKMAML